MYCILLHRQQSSHPVEVICATWNDYSVDFVHLKPVFHTIVVEEGQRKVLHEYLKALLSKSVLQNFTKNIQLNVEIINLYHFYLKKKLNNKLDELSAQNNIKQKYLG